MRLHRLSLVLVVADLLLGGPLARAPSARAEACFAETGYCIQGRFLAHWLANGGLARNGYPLSEERAEILEDGNEYTVQYFERVRLEYHPGNPPPYDILLGQFGRRVLRERFREDDAGYQRAIAPATPNPAGRYFPETGHNLAGRFLRYWQANGGLAQFGFPLTEEFSEYSLGGRTVQYFERARLEHHPENAGTPYDVLLGQFGRDILTQVDRLSGGFGLLYTTNEAVRGAIGRPTGQALRSPGATQAFERGRMLYQDKRNTQHPPDHYTYFNPIYVLCGGQQAGRVLVWSNPHARYAQQPYFYDTWGGSDPDGGGPAPVPGLFLPQRGFGRVWREERDLVLGPVRDCLGYALTADEHGYTIAVQEFERGLMLSSDTPEGRFIYVVRLVRPCGSTHGCDLGASYERFADRSR